MEWGAARAGTGPFCGLRKSDRQNMVLILSFIKEWDL